MLTEHCRVTTTWFGLTLAGMQTPCTEGTYHNKLGAWRGEIAMCFPFFLAPDVGYLNSEAAALQ
ncbi:hypothetical protein HDF17_002395 [Granulicella arctica]|uniref:Uncharacterized protein n=1 Tax=Granulicella arctica TaxID=940613 RepID=A0A7Y9PHM9_9BACT|nr:hypothetical protein [Granulicella arctica]